MSKKIFLSGKAGHGKFALVDDTDYEKLSAYQWHLTAGKYAGSDAAGGTMHRIILNPPADMFVDHINHNTLDNRRKNLRVVSPKENAWNSSKTTSGRCLSKFKGVTKDRYGHWAVMMWKDNKAYTFDSYRTELEAAVIYNQKAKELYGEYACLNHFTKEEQDAINKLSFIPLSEQRMTRSPYHGVSYNTKKKRWGWRFTYKGKLYYNQYCDSPEDARDKLIEFLKTFDGLPLVRKYYIDELSGGKK